MKFIFINSDGLKISGVFSYGITLFKNHFDCKLLLLNVSETLPEYLNSPQRTFSLPPEKSHDIECVGSKLVDIVSSCPEEDFVILPNTTDTAYSAAALCLQKVQNQKIRILGYVHSDHPNPYMLQQKFSPLISKFVGVSQRCVEQLVLMLPRRESDISLLYYPVPQSFYQSKQNLSAPLKLVFSGRLENQQKEVWRLPVLCEALANAQVSYSLTILGDGTEKNHLMLAFDKLSLPETASVKMLGALPQPQVSKYLSHADIFVLVSSYEGTPVALLEAMAARVCPVVMRTESGIADVINHRKNGLIAGQGNIGELVQAIVELDGNRLLLDEYKSCAYYTVTEGFSVERHLEKLQGVLESSLNAQPVNDEQEVDIYIQDSSIIKIVTQASRYPDLPKIIFGGGMFGRKLVDKCLKEGFIIEAVVDSDPSLQGNFYRNIPYWPPERLAEIPTCLVLVGSSTFVEEISCQIVEIRLSVGKPAVKVISC